MEYVKGEPITVYCDRHRLGTRERLAVLDDRPVPKIVDFGVAKATPQQLSERKLFSEMSDPGRAAKATEWRRRAEAAEAGAPPR